MFISIRFFFEPILHYQPLVACTIKRVIISVLLVWLKAMHLCCSPLSLLIALFLSLSSNFSLRVGIHLFLLSVGFSIFALSPPLRLSTSLSLSLCVRLHRAICRLHHTCRGGERPYRYRFSVPPASLRGAREREAKFCSMLYEEGKWKIFLRIKGEVFHSLFYVHSPIPCYALSISLPQGRKILENIH